MNPEQLSDAYQYCRQLAANHYENFPVASILLPKTLRDPVSVIYAFARTADDIADEGEADAITRLQQLRYFKSALNAIEVHAYQGDDPIFIALADVIQRFQLPLELFRDLISAFEQDITQNRYACFEHILDYCRRSANPVGRLILFLQGRPTDRQLQQSDAVCSSLQLINFYQDIMQDLSESNRIYLPLDELRTSHIDEATIMAAHQQNDSSALAPLLRKQYQRARNLMVQGYALGATLSGRIGWEIRAMTLGGIVILNQLMQRPDNCLLQRPRLSRSTMLKIMLLTASKKIYLYTAKQLLQLH